MAWRKLWERALGDADAGRAAAVHLSQLQHARLFADHEAPGLALPPLAPAVAADLAKALAANHAGGRAPSAAQLRVSEGLRALGWAHEHRHVTDDGLLVDMADPAAKVGVAFEQARRGGGAGAAAFKRRLLAAMGWRIVRVEAAGFAEAVDAGAADTYLEELVRRLP